MRSLGWGPNPVSVVSLSKGEMQHQGVQLGGSVHVKMKA